MILKYKNILYIQTWRPTVYLFHVETRSTSGRQCTKCWASATILIFFFNWAVIPKKTQVKWEYLSFIYSESSDCNYPNVNSDVRQVCWRSTPKLFETSMNIQSNIHTYFVVYVIRLCVRQQHFRLTPTGSWWLIWVFALSSSEISNAENQIFQIKNSIFLRIINCPNRF